MKLFRKSKGRLIPKKNVSAHFEEGLLKHEEFCSQLRIAAEDYKNEKTLGHQVRLDIILRFKKMFESISSDFKRFKIIRVHRKPD